MDLSRNGTDRDLYKTIGGLEATVLSHDKRLDEINEKLDILLESNNRIKGGWWMLSGLFSVAVLLGEFSHSIFEAVKRVFG